MKNKSWKIGFGVFLVGLAWLVAVICGKFGYFLQGMIMNGGIAFVGGCFIAEGIFRE